MNEVTFTVIFSNNFFIIFIFKLFEISWNIFIFDANVPTIFCNNTHDMHSLLRFPKMYKSKMLLSSLVFLQGYIVVFSMII